jgi:phenylpropionate dioxygenase-like ring-hydroxylating dioxygenase large terminal subunit
MDTAQDIFDPVHYAKVDLPLAECESLPRWCFTSEAFYAHEVERVFKRAWNLVCRVEEVPKPGDYMTVEAVGEPLIIIRDEDDRLHAFANACQHRGARLLDGTGNCKRAILCPYHGWAFGPDGSLRGAAGMENTSNFDMADWGLDEIRLEVWAGFAFVCFDEGAIDLMTYLGDITEQFASYRFEEMVLTKRWHYDLECNWKIYAENATEDYHTATVHGGTIGKQVCAHVPSKGGHWSSLHMPSNHTVALLPGDAEAFPHISSLEGRPKSGTHFCLILPNVTFACTQDCMWWLVGNPLSAGRMRLSVATCFPRDTVARPDFDEVVKEYYRRWDVSTVEDNDICEIQQRGLASTLRTAGRMSDMEAVTHDLAMWIKARVIDDIAPTREGIVV